MIRRDQLHFCLIDDHDVIHVDIALGPEDDIEAMANEHGAIANRLAHDGIGTRMVITDPAGDLPTLTIVTQPAINTGDAS